MSRIPALLWLCGAVSCGVAFAAAPVEKVAPPAAGKSAPAAAKKPPPTDFGLLTGAAGKSWRYAALVIDNKPYDIAKHAGKRHVYYPDGRLVMVIPGAPTREHGHWEKLNDKAIHISDGEFVMADYALLMLKADRLEYEYDYQGHHVYEVLVPAEGEAPVAAAKSAVKPAPAPAPAPRDTHTQSLLSEGNWTDDPWIRDRYATGKDRSPAGVGKDDRGREKSVDQLLGELEKISAVFVKQVQAGIAGDYWVEMSRVNVIYKDGEQYVNFLNGKELTPDQRRRKDAAADRMLQGMLGTMK